jgi:hypothetical protein
VHFISGDRGCGSSVCERHFAESSRLALTLLRAGISIEQRQTVALTAIVLAHAACVEDRDALAHRLVTSRRFWTADNSRNAQLESTYAPVYESQRPHLVRLATRVFVLSRGESTPRDGIVEAAWWESVRRLHDALPPGGPPVDAILDTCAHLLCNRLGLPLTRESYVRYLAARAVADLNEIGGWVD